MDQAILYQERSGTNLEEFLALEKHVTLPELQPWLKGRLNDYQELRSRIDADITFVFVSGKASHVESCAYAEVSVGGPGVGKGTQCALAVQEFGFHHISVGDLLRRETTSKASPYGHFINESMKSSVLLPAQLTTYLLKQELHAAQARGERQFLIDGFPRSMDQAASFETKISNVYSTISLHCSEEAMRKRLQERAKSSTRIDDDPTVISRRLHTFEENNAPVLQHLQQHGTIYKIDCSGTIEDTYSLMQSAIRRILQL
ncbi:hypothetical protein M409DRAFT_38112 [Zasmidium cellare ATCC 36951]|uniref:Adenylate kinase n=1 Tax=Zasmidium cellare ATCC 36951 TaxID=1080233 RepID=A0A6A6BZA3_ZASCE|nr:uncharacterized protein M409DRAFT_38112 [Zasmidium cellare ATCC 36951]KAF2158746.1 hypothetical protein M409DRAFT_38112 [Zasmidium cellare ATCC 36951]